MKQIIFGTSPQALAKEGLAPDVEPWEDGLRTDPNDRAFEWWYFDAQFSDGSTAVIVFATKPMLKYKGPARPNVALTITRPEGSKTSRVLTYGPADFRAAKEVCDVRIGPHWARGDLHRYQVHAAMDDLAAELEFTGLVPPWRPGAGKAYFGGLDRYFAWLPAVPYGRVEGQLIYDGQAHPVRGSGYHDHNWGNVPLSGVIDHWYWGRAHLGEYTLIFVEQVAAGEYGYTRMPVFMLAKGDRILLGDGRPLRMQARRFIPHPGGPPYPLEVDFQWERGGEGVKLALRDPRLLEATDLLTMLPRWQRPLLRIFSAPYYFRFHADLELTLEMENLSAKVKGPALFEIMILQGKKYPKRP